MDDATIYQRIGEFVVSFQFIESQIRQIGWLLIDPGRKVWPLEELRKEKTDVLANKVGALYREKLHLCRPPDEAERLTEFSGLIQEFHELRRFRNHVLHSAFFEIKGGGEILALMRSNPRFIIDPDTGDKSNDQESLSDASFAAEMKRMAQLSFDLGQHYLQLVAWLPTK